MSDQSSDKFGDLPERRAQGLRTMEEVYGFEMSDGTGAFFDYTADHLFGDIWNRPGLSIEQRRLILIGVLAGRGANDVNSIQLEAAFSRGELDAEQLREIVLLLAHYAGWPTAAALNSIVETIIQRR